MVLVLLAFKVILSHHLENIIIIFSGLFRKTALLTIRIAKDKGKLLRTVFSLVLRDPTCRWEKIRSKKNVLITSSGKDRSQESPIVLMKEKNMMREDRQAGKIFLSSQPRLALFL